MCAEDVGRRVTRDALGVAALICVWTLACSPGWSDRDSAAERPGGSVLRAPIVTEMQTILRDVRVAEERAAATGSGYVGWEELGPYLDRPPPDGYGVELREVTRTGYHAEVEHLRTGLRCILDVGPGRRGAPRCR